MIKKRKKCHFFPIGHDHALISVVREIKQKYEHQTTKQTDQMTKITQEMWLT